MSADSVAQDQLQSFVRRIESLEDEINALNGDKSEVYKEAKGNGFDTKVLRRVIADRRKDATERNEFDAVYQLYWDAIHGVVRAHVENIEEIAAEARAKRSAALDRLAAMDADIIDADTGEILNETPMSHASGQPGGDDPERQDDAASAGETANPRASRNGADGTSEGQGATGAGTEGATPSTGSKIDEPDAAMRPQTAGSETAVANSTPGSGAGTVDAGEANWPSEMTTASPANEPETIPPVADPATVVSEAGDRNSANLLPAAVPVVADISKPNPICRDPEDCGVYASWHLTCEKCKAAAAHRVAA